MKQEEINQGKAKESKTKQNETKNYKLKNRSNRHGYWKESIKSLKIKSKRVLIQEIRKSDTYKGRKLVDRII